MSNATSFKWRHFEAELILLCVRWYLRYALSYRDLGLCCKDSSGDMMDVKSRFQLLLGDQSKRYCLYRWWIIRLASANACMDYPVLATLIIRSNKQPFEPVWRRS